MEYLQAVLFVGLALGLSLLAGLFLALVLFQLHRSCSSGIWLVCLLVLFEAFLPGFPGFDVGIRLYVPDLVTGALGLATLTRLLFGSRTHGMPASWIVFVLAFAASLGIGLASFGTSAGVSARPYFYAVMVTSYVLSFGWSTELCRAAVRSMATLGVLFLLLVFARWVIQFVPIHGLLPEGGRFASSDASLLRVIPSQKTVVLAQMFIVGLFYPGLLPALSMLRVLLPVLLLTVVVLQHRSVWLALIAGVSARFALPQAGRTAAFQLAAVILAICTLGAAAMLLGKGEGITTDVAQAANRATTMSDTVDARIGSWHFMTNKVVEGGAKAVLLGLPFGTSMTRVLVGEDRQRVRVSFQAHNFYVQTFFNLGLLGVLSAVVLYLWILQALFRGLRHPEWGTAAGAMLLLMVAQVVYYFPYGVDYFQALILGTAGCLALSLEAQRRQLGAEAQSQLESEVQHTSGRSAKRHQHLSSP